MVKEQMKERQKLNKQKRDREIDTERTKLTKETRDCERTIMTVLERRDQAREREILSDNKKENKQKRVSAWKLDTHDYFNLYRLVCTPCCLLYQKMVKTCWKSAYTIFIFFLKFCITFYLFYLCFQF